MTAWFVIYVGTSAAAVVGPFPTLNDCAFQATVQHVELSFAKERGYHRNGQQITPLERVMTFTCVEGAPPAITFGKEGMT